MCILSKLSDDDGTYGGATDVGQTPLMYTLSDTPRIHLSVWNTPCTRAMPTSQALSNYTTGPSRTRGVRNRARLHKCTLSHPPGYNLSGRMLCRQPIVYQNGGGVKCLHRTHRAPGIDCNSHTSVVYSSFRTSNTNCWLLQMTGRPS